MKKQTLMYLGLAVIVFLAVNTVVAPFIFIVLLPSFGVVQLNYNLSTQPLNINWGVVSLNEDVTKSVNITNMGRDIVSLNMTYNSTVNLLNYTLGWDAEGSSLSTATSLVANFTLAVYDFNFTVTDEFSVDIQIGDKT